MNERQWELYRLSVVKTWEESAYKRAVSAAIEHKLMILGQQRAPAREETGRGAGAANRRARYAMA